MKRHSVLFRQLFLLFLPLVLAGCAGLGSLEKPRISLADIQVQEIRTMETAFLVQLRVTNPNTTPLEIEGLSCDVELAGRKFASGLQASNQTIPAYESALVPMQVYASVVDMFSSVLGVLENTNEAGKSGKPVGYRLKGKVRVRSGAFSRNLPFVSEGEITL